MKAAKCIWPRKQYNRTAQATTATCSACLDATHQALDQLARVMEWMRKPLAKETRSLRAPHLRVAFRMPADTVAVVVLVGLGKFWLRHFSRSRFGPRRHQLVWPESRVACCTCAEEPSQIHSNLGKMIAGCHSKGSKVIFSLHSDRQFFDRI